MILPLFFISCSVPTVLTVRITVTITITSPYIHNMSTRITRGSERKAAEQALLGEELLGLASAGPSAEARDTPQAQEGDKESRRRTVCSNPFNESQWQG